MRTEEVHCDMLCDVMTCNHDGSDQKFEAWKLRFAAAVAWAAGFNAKPSRRVAMVVPMVDPAELAEPDREGSSDADTSDGRSSAEDSDAVPGGQLWDVRIVCDDGEDFKVNPQPVSMAEALELVEEIGRPVRFVIEPFDADSKPEEVRMLDYSSALCSQLSEAERYVWFDQAKEIIANRDKAEWLQPVEIAE